MNPLFDHPDLRVIKIEPDLALGIVSDGAGIESLERPWRELETRCASRFSYFQSFDWCRAWASGPGSKRGWFSPAPFVVTVWRKNRLAAVLPLTIERRKYVVRILGFMGAPMIQYADPLVDDKLLNRVELAKCWAAATAHASCDAIWLDHLPEKSVFSRSLDDEKMLPGSATKNAMIDLTVLQTLQDYLASQSKNARKANRRKRAALEAMGKISRKTCWSNEPGFAQLVEQAFIMKAEWLKETGRPVGLFRKHYPRNFIRTLPARAEEKAGAVAICLMLDDKPIAMEIGFCHHNHYYSYIGAFDWSLRDLSPGRIQMEEAIGWAIENGFETFDFLGNPTQTKEARSSHAVALLAFSETRTLPGMLYGNFWRSMARPALKRSYYFIPSPVRRHVIENKHILALIGALGAYASVAE